MKGFAAPWWAPWRRCWARLLGERCLFARSHPGDHAVPTKAGFDLVWWS